MKKMNKVDYLDMPVAYAMDQPIFFNNRSKNSLTSIGTPLKK